MLQRLSYPFDEELYAGDGLWSRSELEEMNDRFVAAVEQAFASGGESRTAAAATMKMNGKPRADEIVIELAWRYLRTNMEAGIDVTFFEVAGRCPGVDPHKVYTGIKRRLIEARKELL